MRMTEATIEMDARQELLVRLERVQTEIVMIDGLLRKVSSNKIGGRLVGNLIETANAIEALLLVRP
jgi:hypothetical protein